MEPARKKARLTTAADSGSSVAQAPFDVVTNADAILRTEDNVDFHLYRAVLSLASPVFRDMFSLPQPSQADVPASTPERIPISEDSRTFDSLMRLCYPVDDPVMKELSHVEKVLDAAIKYQMAEAIKLSCTALRAIVESRPQEVYAISCRLLLEEEAKLAAAKLQTKIPSEDLSKDFKSTTAGRSFDPCMANISSGAYFRLLFFLRGTRSLSTMNLTDGGNPFHATLAINRPASSPKSPARNNMTYAYDTENADAILLSRDNVQFPVHALVLRLASADALLGGVRVEPLNEREPGKLPMLPVDLGSDTLSELLRICYPVQDSQVEDLDTLISICNAAARLRIPKVLSVIQRRFNHYIPGCSNLTSLYLIAVQQGWKKEARAVAQAIAEGGVSDAYSAEMEHTPALHYHNLLLFCHSYRLAMRSVLHTRAPHYDRTANLYPLASVALPLVQGLLADMKPHICNHSPNFQRSSGTKYNPPQLDQLLSKSNELNGALKNASLKLELQ